MAFQSPRRVISPEASHQFLTMNIFRTLRSSFRVKKLSEELPQILLVGAALPEIKELDNYIRPNAIPEPFIMCHKVYSRYPHVFKLNVVQHFTRYVNIFAYHTIDF